MTRHPAFALLLAALLALTTQTAAVARGLAAVPGMTVTLCAGDGAETVTLDVTGKPVAPAHHCPVCVMALALPDSAATVPGAVQQVRALRVPASLCLAAPPRFTPVPPARAPPLST